MEREKVKPLALVGQCLAEFQALGYKSRVFFTHFDLFHFNFIGKSNNFVRLQS